MTNKPLKSTAKAIIERNKQDDDRAKVSLYMSQSLYERFKKVCDKENAPASRVLEDLIREFLTSLKE